MHFRCDSASAEVPSQHFLFYNLSFLCSKCITVRFIRTASKKDMGGLKEMKGRQIYRERDVEKDAETKKIKTKTLHFNSRRMKSMFPRFSRKTP